MQPVILRTARLELSVPTAADVDEIFRACQDPAIQRYTTVPVPYARADAEGFVDLAAGWWEAGVEVTWGIRHEGRLAGMIGIHGLGRGHGEIGYWIGPGSRGSGILSEAARSVIDWAFSSDGLGLARLEWRAAAGNIASARSARTLGFRYEGLLRRAFAGSRGHEDCWIAGLLPADERSAQAWPILQA